MSTADATTEVGERDCWCCGQQRPDSDLLSLGAHPEVAVCLRCARYLNRRARQRQDRSNPTAGARVRAVAASGRQVVIEHGWHRLPILGPVLRWLGDRLP